MPTFTRKSKKVEKSEVNSIAYEKREKIYPLSVFVTIINRDQSKYFVDAYNHVGASTSMVLYAHSMPPRDVISVLGTESLKKEIIFTTVREEYIPKLKEIAAQRFAISRAAKGIAFALPISSVGGIAVYKFLSDQNKEERESNNGKRK